MRRGAYRFAGNERRARYFESRSTRAPNHGLENARIDFRNIVRAARYFESRSTRAPNHGLENARQWRGGEKSLVEHRPSHQARRSEIRNGLARRLRMVVRQSSQV